MAVTINCMNLKPLDEIRSNLDVEVIQGDNMDKVQISKEYS